MKYAIAPSGVFWSIQGEGHLQGFQQAFLRLAHCSFNCPGCDTNYSKAESLTLDEIVERLRAVIPVDDRDCWIWITGGEPADLPQPKQIKLVGALKAQGWSVCVATSGVKRFIPPVDWLSVSPHSSDPAKFQQRYGNEIKLIDGLNGLDLWDWHDKWNGRSDALYRYVQPLSVFDGETWSEDPESLERCFQFLKEHPQWALSQQRHHAWGVA